MIDISYALFSDSSLYLSIPNSYSIIAIYHLLYTSHNIRATHLANDLLTGGTTTLELRLLVPTLAALGEKANAEADVAASANKTTFFMTNILFIIIMLIVLVLEKPSSCLMPNTIVSVEGG